MSSDSFIELKNVSFAYGDRPILQDISLTIPRGKLVAIMVMADDKVRTWSDADAHLLEQVAERTVFAVESARAATALREYRDVLQLAMTTARMGAWSRDLTRGTLWWSPEFAELVGFGRDDTNYSRERMFALIGDDDIVYP